MKKAAKLQSDLEKDAEAFSVFWLQQRFHPKSAMNADVYNVKKVKSGYEFSYRNLPERRFAVITMEVTER